MIDGVETYEVPKVEFIEVEIEKGFASSSLENPEKDEETGW